MRTVFSIAALLMTLSAGAAFAQQTPDTTPPASSTKDDAATKADAPPPPPPPGPQAGSPMEPRPDWRRGPMGHRPPPPPSKAAHFRIETGDIKIDIKCAEDEPTKACADELNQILDRLQGSSSRDDDYR